MAKQVAVITGASSGIGLEFARQLARSFDLLLVARRLDRLEEVAAGLRAEFGAGVEVLAADLVEAEDLARVEVRLAAEPRLGLLVNNAGFGFVNGRFWEQDVAAQEEMFRLHVLATMRLSHAALRNMVARDAGAVINVGSVAGFLMRPGTAVYSTTKGWAAKFTEAVALDLAKVGSKVRVQALCPGFTYTEFHDVLGIDRKKVAPAAFWMSAADVVRASLVGLEKGKLVVVPGWRYRWMVGVLGRLPRGLKNAAIRAGSSRK